MLKSFAPLLSILLWLVLITPAQAANSALGYIDKLPEKSGWLLIDTRLTASCIKRSLKNAHCLAADSLMTPARRVPNLKDIAWMLGTLGLRGDESIVVTGNQQQNRDFVAGILYLSGQKNVRVLQTPLHQLLAMKNEPTGSGKARHLSRLTIYSAHPRDSQMVLLQELRDLISNKTALRMLDTRSDAEYWGHRIRGYRGGHIPGAEKWGQSSGLLGIELEKTITIMYGHDPVETIASFTRLQSRWEQPIRALIEGWRSWANNGALPVDAESFNDTAPTPAGTDASKAIQTHRLASLYL